MKETKKGTETALCKIHFGNNKTEKEFKHKHTDPTELDFWGKLTIIVCSSFKLTCKSLRLIPLWFCLSLSSSSRVPLADSFSVDSCACRSLSWTEWREKEMRDDNYNGGELISKHVERANS